MKTNVFYTALTSKQIQENIEKQFNSRVNLVKYNREQLEDIRNKLRTKIFQHESTAKYNDLLTNETYQKDQAMLQLLNTRIREMLGEDIKKLRDKMVEISEGKKIDQNKDGKNDWEDVKIARMKASGAIPEHTRNKKAKEVEEGFEDKLAAARELAAEKGLIKDTEEKPSHVRQVKGKAYGGSKQAADQEDDEDSKPAKPAKKTAAKKTAAKKTAAKKTVEESIPGDIEEKLRQFVEAHEDYLDVTVDSELKRRPRSDIGKELKRRYDEIEENTGLEDPYDIFDELVNQLQDQYGTMGTQRTSANKTAAKKTAAKKTAAKKKKANESMSCNHTDEGVNCPVHGMTECGGMWEGADDADDKGEYGNEGDNAKDHIHTIRREADRLEKSLTDDEDLPEWVQDKLARIQGMMSDVSEYMQTQDERDHEDETGEEGSASTDDNEQTMAEGQKWVKKAVAGVKKGALRKQEHMKKGEKFSSGKLKALAKSGTPTEKKRAQFALNIKKKNESQFLAKVNYIVENVHRMINEDEEGKAKTITAASDMVNDFTSWMQRVGQYQTKALVELADAIKADFGAAEAEQFKQAVSPALAQTLETLTSQREVISNAVAVLAGEESAQPQMGGEPGMEPSEPGMEPSEPDMMNEPTGGDEFGASDAAAGVGATGREMRESRAQRRARKLAESHSILTKLSR